jgi:hypothetical protein
MTSSHISRFSWHMQLITLPRVRIRVFVLPLSDRYLQEDFRLTLHAKTFVHDRRRIPSRFKLPAFDFGIIASEIILRESLTEGRFGQLALYAGRKQSFRLCKTLNIDAHGLRSVDTWNPQKSAEPESWQGFAINRQRDVREPGMAWWLLHKLHVTIPLRRLGLHKTAFLDVVGRKATDE